jgi:hypothetical protein
VSRKKKDAKQRRRQVRKERQAARGAHRPDDARARAEADRLARIHAIRREMSRAGVNARCEAVRKAVRDPKFTEAMQLAIQTREIESPLLSAEQIRDLAFDTLRAQWSADLAGVDLKVIWEPAKRALSFRVVPAIAAVMMAAEKVDQQPEMRA